MVNSNDDIKVFHLDLPARREDIARLELGSAVYLNGVVYTAREGVYKKVLDDGQELPAGQIGRVFFSDVAPFA